TFSKAFSNFCFRSCSVIGEMLRDFPSVVISRGVSSLILRISNIALSITRAMLLPCFVSFLIMITSFLQVYLVYTLYHHCVYRAISVILAKSIRCEDTTGLGINLLWFL